MNKLFKSSISLLYIYTAIAVFCSSCITTKQIKYFQGIPDSTKLGLFKTPAYNPPIIHTDDVLSINIATNEIAAAASANALNVQSSGEPQNSGYQVDSLGYVQIPTIGSIKVVNLTLQQATDLIKQYASKNFNDVVVVVKIRSFKVTLIGEVNKPGILYINTPRVNMIDIIGLSGDLTPYARRDNILLLRHYADNTISAYRVNLNNNSIFNSPVYYIQSNDVIYVEPTNSRAIASDQSFTRNLTLGTLGLSVLTTILYLFR